MKETKIEKQIRLDWYEQILAMPGCWLQDLFPHTCQGPRDPMHFIPKSFCKTESRLWLPEKRSAFIWDARNGKPGCRKYHGMMDNPNCEEVTVYQSQLPGSVHEFVEDWGPSLDTPERLKVKLDQTYPQGDPV